MKIVSLELFGCKRLALNNMEFIRITLTEVIQLILGTNGSGKSSLLSELTPLPANSQDYKKDGYKIINLESNSNSYTLKNDFSISKSHSFIKNNEELNPGGTLTIQRDLVKQEFNITPDIHELLISQSSFSSLSINDRRQWFTKLSDVNYDYAISIYAKLKEKLTIVSGALKLAKKRLVIETSKLITQEEQTALQDQVDDLHSFIQHLSEYRIPVEIPINTLLANATNIETDLSKLSNLLFKKKLNLKKDINYLNINEIEIKINELQSLVSVENILINNYIKDFNKLEELSNTMKLTENKTVASLLEQISFKRSEKTNLIQRQKLKLDITDYSTATRSIETIYDILNTVFISLPVNETVVHDSSILERKFSKQKLQQTSEFILNYKDLINKLTSDLNKLQHQKDHQESQRDDVKIECPKCKHTWAKGFDLNFYNSICRKIEIIQNELDEATVVLLEKETYQVAIKEYSDIFRDFTNCVNNWPVLKPLWDYILKDNNIYTNPRSVLTTIEAFKYDLTLGLQIESLNTENLKLLELIKIAEKTDNEDIDNINRKLIEAEDLVNTSTNKISSLTIRISDLQNYKKDIEFILDLESKITNLLNAHELTIANTKETYRRLALNDLIRAVQSNLSRKEQLLSEIKIKKAIVTDLETQVVTMELDNEAYKLLVKELSPSDGLIAHGLLGFIKIFIKQMNLLIKKIWAYPLEVIPCGISDSVSVELDYKFPLLVESKDNIRPDISKGSSAMKEVIDLAFKITSMGYLGLSETPLYLDEFGISFDSSHRVVANDVIKNLMNLQSFSQLFMISHYEASYGSLVNAEICVLCQNNIVIPKDAIVNRHVLMS